MTIFFFISIWNLSFFIISLHCLTTKRMEEKCTLENLIEYLKDNELSFAPISISEINDLMKFVHIDLKIDSETFDCLYEIDVKELLDSAFPINKLNDLKTQGWAITNNNTKLQIYYKT